MSSSTKSDVESLTATGGSTGFLGVFTRKWKIALSVSLLLGAVAVIGICAAAVVAGINIGGKEGRKTDSARSLESHDIDNKAYEDAEGELIRNRRLPSHAEEVQFRPSSSCYSDALNDSLPAAHIRGEGYEWEPSKMSTRKVYQPRWECNTSLAFVAGGMWFQQDSNSLHVPKCGWYYVSSEIAFQNNGPNTTSHSYGLRIDRNCGSHSASNSYARQGSTVNGPIQGKLESITSIHINDVVKICQGGSMSVIIPLATNDCCPRGYSETTSLTAHLISESDCQWPVPLYKHPREQYQQQS